MILTSNNDLGLHVLRGVANELKRLGDDFSVPICAQLKGGDPRQLGSGSFLRIATDWFLVTASHVVEDLFPPRALKSGHANDCDVLVPGQDDALVTLSGHVTGTFSHDVAVLRLGDPSPIRDRWRPITLSEVVRPADPAAGWYHFAGWPIERSQKVQGVFQAEKYRFTCSHDPTGVEHVPEHQVVLPISLTGHVTFAGEAVSVPHLEGVSGAPVWRIFPNGSARLEPRLAAVQTGYVDQNQHWYVKATRWPVVRTLITRACPGLVESAERLVL